MKEERKFKIFIDFDGTITTDDIGEKMFLKFSDKEANSKVIDKYSKEEITSPQMWKQMCKNTINFDEKAFNDYLETVELDEAFKKFLNYAEEHNFDIYVLSDGMDYYIKKIFEKEGIDHLKVFSNKLSFNSNNELVPNFPYTDAECSFCANCKRNHIIENSSDEDITVYIGDGNSDKCPVEYVDYVFAKNELLKHCEINRITFFPYINFHNVIRRMEQLRKKKNLKKRHHAQLKRRDVYLQG